MTKAARWAYSSDVHSRTTPFAAAVLDALDVEYKLYLRQFRDLRPRLSSQISGLLTFFPEGTSAGTHVGNWIRPVSLDVSFVVSGDTSTTTPFYKVRVGCFQYLEDLSSGAFDANDLMADQLFPEGPYDYTLKDKVKILYDWTFTVSNEPTNPLFVHQVSASIDISGLPQVMYDASFPKRNAILFFAISNAESGGNDPAPLVDISSSIYFTDS